MKKSTMAHVLWCAMIAVATLSLSGACAAVPSALVSTPETSAAPIVVANADYRVQEEDILRLDVWGEPQLSNVQMQVTPDGKINVPYIGDIQVCDPQQPDSGHTQAELTKIIAQKLDDAGILVLPKVVITLLSLHKPTVRVLGAVSRSGEFPFKEGDRVLDAVAQAGYVDNSLLEKVTLTRRGPDQQQERKEIDLTKILKGDFAQNYELRKGDVINVPPEEYENKFYVMGQVNRPMMYDLKDKTRVLAAINLAGGPTERAAIRSTVVLRANPKDPAKPEKVNCDLSKVFDKADLTQDVELEAGDVVYVPETKKPNWPKISQILSTISSLTYIRRYGLF